jgi:transcriptional regulator with PAS, ATPase and Fis domain
VRQLENAIISAVNTEKSNVIEPESLPAYIDLDKISQIDDMNDLQTICSKMGERFSLVNWEQTALKAALAASNNYIPLAADLLKISKSTMYRKLKLFNIDSTAKTGNSTP